MQLEPELISTSNINEAIVLADSCFHTFDEQAHFRDTYIRIAEGRTFYQDDDMGCPIRLLPYFLYRQNKLAVGTTGLYACNDDISRLWLGWFGIAPSVRGQGVGSVVLSHISSVAALYGARELALYTSEHENIDKVKKFYVKNGFHSFGNPHNYREAKVFEYVKKLN